ncbi:nucleotide pyrophosphohydrolase [Lentibacillus halophilus]|uniref:Nucleotide pyrophosphohydrolase n=1 Tax=Lentibacillus halophilus TaxID=295065 RepID=A0ABP3J751_9BACI
MSSSEKSLYRTNDIQNRVHQYIGQFKEGYFSPLSLMARLSEETGELAREVNHLYGEKPKKASEHPKAMEEELGDVLFVLTCFANSLDIDMSNAFDRSMQKFETRDSDRWTKKDS